MQEKHMTYNGLNGINCKDNAGKFQRRKNCMQQHPYEHFYSDAHSGFQWNTSISLIDKTDGVQIKERENSRMRTLKTLAQQEVNVESIL